MKMLVLAGGFGTRLRSAVSDVPKPLAPVAGAPFLHYQLEHWIAQGVRSFAFLLHHQADLIVRFLDERGQGLLSGCGVNWLVEPEPLDTGGAIAYAVQQLGLDGEFLVANADTWLGDGIPELVRAGADAMAVIRQQDVGRYGQVEFDGDHRVTGFREKGESHGAGWINAGLSLLKAAHFRAWDGRRFSLERALFPALLAAGRLRAVPLETDFIDIGIPEDYARFCHWQESGREARLCS